MRNVIAIFLAIVTIGTALGNPTAKISKSWVSLNVMHQGRKSLALHGKLSIEGLKGKKVLLEAYMMSEPGKGHPDTNGKFKSADGAVAASEMVKVPYDITNWGDYIVYLPNDEMHPLSGDAIYYVCMNVNYDGKTLASGEPIPFVASSLSDNTEIADNFNPSLKRWKENESKDGFVLVAQQRDGSETRTQWYKCTSCNGYLKCARCNGTGRCKVCGGKRGQSSMYGMHYDCVECKKTGKCAACVNHVGKCRCSTGEYPGFVLENDPDYTPEPGGEWWNDI